MDWLLNQGKTDSSNTGPHVDHTLGTDEGVYIYLESSYPASNGDKAILSSEYLDKTTSMGCFSLWYFMHGKDVGAMSVYLNDSLTAPRLLAGINGEQGANWQKLEMEIKHPSEFRLYIEGMVSSNASSYEL